MMIQSIWKEKKIRWGIITMILAVVVIIIGIIIIPRIVSASGQEEEIVYKETTVTRGNITAGITESGTTAIGSVSLEYDVEPVSISTGTSSSSSGSSGGTAVNNIADTSGTNTSASSSATLEVEEVYVTTSQVVEEGEPILKVTDESYTKVKEKLEKTVDSAKISLSEAKINREIKATEAEYTLKTNKAKAEVAPAEYNATIQALADEVTNTKAKIEEADAEIAEYQSNISNNTYYIDYEIDSLAAIVNERQGIVSDLQNQIAVLTATDTATDTENAADIDSAAARLSELQVNLESAQRELNEANTTYTGAVKNYETALSTAKSRLSELLSSYSSLVANYEKAVRVQTTAAIEAEQTLEEELIVSENAQTLYNIEVDGIDDEVETAEETLEAAQEALDSFYALVVDGIIYSNCSGTITDLGYEAGDEISSGTTIATFGDTEEVTLTVSVDQEDISSIAIGDVVNIYFSAYSGILYNGEVTAIGTSPTSENSSTVSYPITVTVTGDVSSLYAGMTGDVTFITKEIKDVLYVSNKAIITEGSKSYVKVKESEDVIQKIEIETGFSDGNNVEITSGLEEGDIALIESQVSGK